MANGIIPQNQQAILLEIGNWLQINGEAIYDSRTWSVFGEGPTKQEKSGMFLDKITYTPQDVRYTKKGDTIYAIILGWPGNDTPITLKSFTKATLGENIPYVKRLSILGFSAEVPFTQNNEGLHFSTPNKKIDDKSFVVKIETE